MLVIAEAANPEWVSVPLVGWSLARALAEVADVHLVTQVRNRAAIERTGLRADTDFTPLDTEAWTRPLWRAGQLLRGGGTGWSTAMAVSALTYPIFETLLWRRFGARIRAGEWDVVHRVTPLSPTIPSPLARRCARAGVPFVLGPLNGGTPWPRGFGAVRRREGEWLSYVRGAYRLVPGYRATRRHARALIVGSRAAWNELPARHRSKAVYVPENGVDPERLPAARRLPETEGPLRVAFLGRLVPYKGPDMLVEAMLPLLRERRATLELVGDGPLRTDLERRVAESGVGDGVRFAGWREHREALESLARAHVLGFPSIREFGGGVVLEALALGVVPVVVDYGGPAELVSEATGFRLPLGPRERIVRDLAARLAALAAERTALRRLSEAGPHRVARWFTWRAKAAQVLEVLHWAAGRRPERPWYGMPFPDDDHAAGPDREDLSASARGPADASGGRRADAR